MDCIYEMRELKLTKILLCVVASLLLCVKCLWRHFTQRRDDAEKDFFVSFNSIKSHPNLETGSTILSIHSY